MDFSVVFLLMPNMNDTISEQTGELLKLWLSILSKIDFQRRKFKKNKPTSKIFETWKKKNARRQSYYGIKKSIGQGNVQTQKVFIPCFFLCLLFAFSLNTNLLKHKSVPMD